MPGPEAQLSDAIRRLMHHHSIPCYCTSTHRVRGSTGASPGLPDLILLPVGEPPLFVELKTPRGRLSNSQKQFAEDVERTEGKHAVWRSVQDAVDWVNGDED